MTEVKTLFDAGVRMDEAHSALIDCLDLLNLIVEGLGDESAGNKEIFIARLPMYFGALSMLQRGMLQLSEELEYDCNAVMNAHNKQREAQNGQQPQVWN